MPRNNSKAEEVFSAAWAQVVAGRNIELVVADYPDHAPELEQMLRLVLAVKDLPAPSLSASALARIQSISWAAAQQRLADSGAVQADGNGVRSAIGTTTDTHSVRTAQHIRTFSLASFLPSLRGRAAVLLFLLTVLVIAVGSIAILRQAETQPQLVSLVSYRGIITRITATAWMVGQTEILIDPTTKIHGQPTVGAVMVCVGQDVPAKDQMRAVEIWVGMEPTPPLIVPTRLPYGNSMAVQAALP
jgi:hypothetical protein